MPRDLVRFQPNIRVDLPEMKAVQRNSRSESHAGMLQLARGDAVSNADRRRIIKGFTVAQNGVPDSNAVVSRGTAMGGTVLEDGTTEFGVFFGAEGPSTILVDFAAKAIGLYAIYIRFTEVPGVAGTRIFWNDNTDEEETQSIDTRLVLTWQATTVLNAAPTPGEDWIKVATVDWDGAAVVTADITDTRKLFFEGDVTTTFAYEWGDGVNDRSADRAAFPIADIWTWIQMVRRQIEEIVGDPVQHYYEVPFTSLYNHEIVQGFHQFMEVDDIGSVVNLFAGINGGLGGSAALQAAESGGGAGLGPLVIFDLVGPPHAGGAGDWATIWGYLSLYKYRETAVHSVIHQPQAPTP